MSDRTNPGKPDEPVEIHVDGKRVATLRRTSQGIHAAVLLEALLRLGPDPETADEIAGHIEDMRKARTFPDAASR